MVFSNSLSLYINLNLHNHNHPILFMNDNKLVWTICTYITHIIHYAMTNADLEWISRNIDAIVKSVHIEAYTTYTTCTTGLHNLRTSPTTSTFKWKRMVINRPTSCHGTWVHWRIEFNWFNKLKYNSKSWRPILNPQSWILQCKQGNLETNNGQEHSTNAKTYILWCLPALTSIHAHQISNTNVKTALLLGHSYIKVDMALEIVTLTSRNTH